MNLSLRLLLLGPLLGMLIADNGHSPLFAQARDGFSQEVYLTPTEALRQVLPKPLAIESVQLQLTEEERHSLAQSIGRRFFESGFRVFRGVDDRGRVAGYAVITEEIGKFQPITFVVGVTPQGKISQIAVMVYRESHGADVKRRRFLAQFDGKGMQAPLRINRDIVNISGATLSVRAVARGARKILHVVVAAFIAAQPLRETEELRWEPWVEEVDAQSRSDDRTGTRQLRYVMGTLLEIELDEATSAQEVLLSQPAMTKRVTAAEALSSAFQEVQRLDRLWSLYDPCSELSRFSRHPVGKPLTVSRETLDCVALALQWARRTAGAFDPTLLPDGYLQIELDATALTLTRLRADIRVDVGGIGKGLALDRAAEVLRELGQSRALLNFGGQVMALDPPSGCAGWWVGLRDPRSPSEICQQLCIENLSLATSADYERGAHVIDPQQRHDMTSVLGASVLSASAATADALSTIFRIGGGEAIRCMEAAASAGDVEGWSAWIVERRGSTRVGGRGLEFQGSKWDSVARATTRR